MQLHAHKSKTVEKGTEWGTMESCPTFPPYGGDMEGNHYDLRTARKKGNELS